MFQDEVFWSVTPCSFAVRYRCFCEPCYLQLQKTKFYLHGNLNLTFAIFSLVLHHKVATYIYKFCEAHMLFAFHNLINFKKVVYTLTNFIT